MFWNDVLEQYLECFLKKVYDICICFMFLIPFLRFKMTFKLNFFSICSSDWLGTRQDSSVKHQSKEVFGKSSAILVSSTFSQALRLRRKLNKHQPSWSCLRFLSLLCFFPWMTGTFPYFSLLSSCILKENLRREADVSFHLCRPLEIMWRQDFFLWMSEYIHGGCWISFSSRILLDTVCSVRAKEVQE